MIAIMAPFRIYSQYDSRGYNAKYNSWNVQVNELTTLYRPNNMDEIYAFTLNIQNNTTYSINAIDIELTFTRNKKVFFKKNCHVTLSEFLNPGEVMTTKEWYFDPPFHYDDFKKEYTFTYKVYQVYIPKDN